MLGGGSGAAPRSCAAPGCPLFFVKHHPRREWCSAACGNRARVARHYARQRPDCDRAGGSGSYAWGLARCGYELARSKQRDKNIVVASSRWQESPSRSKRIDLSSAVGSGRTMMSMPADSAARRDRHPRHPRHTRVA
nr:CGNR zinc finger domain-containing protein [Frankia sp. EI5c]